MASKTGFPSSTAADSPVYKHVVTDTRKALTYTEIAEVTGVKLRSVQNWASGASRPDAPARDRLLELKYVVEQLGDVYEPEGIQIWLHSPQRKLDGKRPVDCLREGQFERVLRAVEFLAGGPRN